MFSGNGSQPSPRLPRTNEQRETEIKRLTMKRQLWLLALTWLTSISMAQGDQLIASAQQLLKEQGFYYGNVDGKKSADTTAAIRRYQIRNGLGINGELTAETQRSLGIRAGTSSAPAKGTPSSIEDDRPPPDNSPAPRNKTIPAARPSLTPGYIPGPHGLQPETSGALDGTPYEIAPPDLQQRVIAGAQTMLARRGYYRTGIDGVYGPGTESALRAYQSRVGLEATGRLDLETLAALGMLPGAHGPATPPGNRPRSKAVLKGKWIPD